MKTSNIKRDYLLLEYLDNTLNKADRLFVEKMIAEKPAWAAAMQSIQFMNDQLKTSTIVKAPPGFKEQVLKRIQSVSYSVSIRNGRMLLLGIVTLCLLLIGFLYTQEIDMYTGSIGFGEKSPFGDLNYSLNLKLIIKSTIFLNLLLALLILDQTILKPLFRRGENVSY